MKYERETSNLLRRLGVNNSYVGFRYTIYGVIRSIHDPRNMKSCLCRPIADGDHMAVCFIKSRLCKPNQREQQFLLYLADEIKKF